MRPLKRTYTLPADVLESFERQVAADKRSAVVAELLRDWLNQQRREQLRREVIAGCRDMADVYREVERAFHPLEEEVERVLGDKPEGRS